MNCSRIKYLFQFVQVNLKFIAIRNSSSQLTNQPIVGRDFLNISDYTAYELKCIIWTALDLKCRFRKWPTQDKLNVKEAMITSLLSKPCIQNQVNIKKSSLLLSGKACIIVDRCWESTSLIDTGRMLSNLSNVILASAECCEQSLFNLAAGASVPVIDLGSKNSCPITALGYALTILTSFGRLERLRVAWVGPSDSPILGSLLLLLPKLRVHFYIITENCRHPCYLDEALKLASVYRSEVHHVEKLEQAIYKADAVITTSHSFSPHKITRKHMDNAALNWIFLHDLPRSSVEVTDEVFYMNKKSLVWESAENRFWVLLAVIVKVLYDYTPIIPAPSFTED